jgi:prepilin-type N-terminal cleavage/methylation domain-containing protein
MKITHHASRITHQILAVIASIFIKNAWQSCSNRLRLLRFARNDARTTKGFTLIELSIVLVIIGLIVGGVLVGQDLITSASIRKQISQLSEVETSINVFRIKYDELPCDFSKATQFFGTTDSKGYIVGNGNGNGKIVSSISVYAPSDNLSAPATEFRYGIPPNEVQEVFHHLVLSGLINYDITTPSQYTSTLQAGLPKSTLNDSGALIVTDIDGGRIPNFATGTAILIGANNTWNSRFGSTRIYYTIGFLGNNIPMVPPKIGQQLDSKIDDGISTSGSVGMGFTCTGASNLSYQSISSDCNISMVKRLWK